MENGNMNMDGQRSIISSGNMEASNISSTSSVSSMSGAPGVLGASHVSGMSLVGAKKDDWKVVKAIAAVCALVIVLMLVITITIRLNDGGDGAVAESRSYICEMEIGDDLSVYDTYDEKYELYNYFYHCTATGQVLMLAMENSDVLWGVDDASDADLGMNEYMKVDESEMEDEERRLWKYLY